MGEWFNDDEVNDLLAKLMDRLCSLERMTGDALDSMLVLIPTDKKYPVLFAHGGKPWYPRVNDVSGRRTRRQGCFESQACKARGLNSR